MSETLLDWKSWKRAWKPAIRTFGYIAVLYVLLIVVILIPAYILVALGAPFQIFNTFTRIITILMVLAMFLAFFKVLDEERPGSIPLEIKK